MPYIDVQLSCKLSKEQETVLKTELGQLIEKIPGKTEARLMLRFQDNCRLWYQGKNSEDIAFVNVMLFGKAEAEAYRALAQGIIALMDEKINVPAANVYVKFEEVPNWFWG